MAIKPVLKMGDPRLLQRSAEIDPHDDETLQPLLRDMWDTMAAENGAGLAAPQIGVLQRVVIFGCASNPRYPEAPAVPETVLINPEIRPLDDSMEEGWEGCLSVPGLRGLVPRYRHIHYRGYDQHGQLIEREASDFHARVVQHECDHLDGILYPLRMRDLRQLGYIDALTDNGLLQAQPCDDDA